MTATRIMVDEGGVRHDSGGERRYVPFAAIVDVELRTRRARDPAIAVTLDGCEEELVLFAGGAALEVHRELVEHLEARRGRAAHAVPDGWRRNARPLGAWLAALRASTEVGYREVAHTRAETLTLADDADADIEARAAAIHLLVGWAEGSDLVDVAKVLAGRSLPPLVQVVAYLAPGGPAFVDAAAFAEAVSFVAPADREELRTIVHPTDADDLHLAAAAEAKRVLDEEARRVASSPPPARATRLTVAMSDRDTSRWVGRSWGL